MNKVKAVIGVMGLLLFFNSFAIAQNEDKPKKDRRMFAEGSKDLLFEFDGFSDLGAGSYLDGFGAKYFLSQKMAIRGVLQIESRKESNPFNPPPGSGDTGKDGEEKFSRFGIAAAVEMHTGAKRVSPFWGGGIGFSSASSEEKLVSTDPDPQIVIKNENGYTEIAVFALLGAEFFLYKKLISLAAEYQLGYYNRSNKDEKVTSGNQTTTIKQGSDRLFGITNSGLLTLAVYLP